MNQKKGK